MSHFTSKIDIFMFECHGRSQFKTTWEYLLVLCKYLCTACVVLCGPPPAPACDVLHSEACLGRRRRCSKMCPHAMVNYVTKIFGT